MSKVIIRRAAESEVETISELPLRSKAHWKYSEDFIEACRGELTYSQNELKKNFFYVAVLDASIIGFYALGFNSENEIELEALFVKPTYIGKGYGRILIAHAKVSAKHLGGKRMIIQGDPSAEGFYRAVGGQPLGQSPSGSIPGRYLPTFALNL